MWQLSLNSILFNLLLNTETYKYAGNLCECVNLECAMFSQVPVARASILWLIGEYCERVPKIAPDVLRKTAKTFTNEDDLVKLQILNLGAKLYLTNSKQVSLNSEVYIFRVTVGFCTVCIYQL